MIVSLINNMSDDKSDVLKLLSDEILKNNSPLVIYRYSYGEDTTELFKHIVDTEEVISLTESPDNIIHIFCSEYKKDSDIYSSILNAAISENIDVSVEVISDSNPISDSSYTGNREKFNISMEVSLPSSYDIKFITILADAINSYAIPHFDTYSELNGHVYDFGFMKSPKGWWYRKTQFNPNYPIESYYMCNKILHTMVKGNHKYYFIDANGYCVKQGWHTIEGTSLTFYTNDESEIYIGWHLIDGIWYYFSESTETIGKMLDGTVEIDGTQYHIIKGKLHAEDQTMFDVDADGKLILKS